MRVTRVHTYVIETITWVHANNITLYAVIIWQLNNIAKKEKYTGLRRARANFNSVLLQSQPAVDIGQYDIVLPPILA